MRQIFIDNVRKRKRGTRLHHRRHFLKSGRPCLFVLLLIAVFCLQGCGATDEEKEQIRQEGREIGKEEGRTQGKIEGYNSGVTVGRAEGYVVGSTAFFVWHIIPSLGFGLCLGLTLVSVRVTYDYGFPVLLPAFKIEIQTLAQSICTAWSMSQARRELVRQGHEARSKAAEITQGAEIRTKWDEAQISYDVNIARINANEKKKFEKLFADLRAEVLKEREVENQKFDQTYSDLSDRINRDNDMDSAARSGLQRELLELYSNLLKRRQHTTNPPTQS